MLRRGYKYVVCGCLMLAASSLQAAEAPLSVFPSDTGVIVKLSSPNKVIKNLADAVNLVQPGFGSMVQGQASNIGIGISNPTLQGVDMDKDWWMGVFTHENAEPQVVFVIPATDVGDMEDAIDESFAFTKQGNWGIYSEDEEAVARVQAVIDGSGKSIEPNMTGKLLASFGAGDLSIYVNTPTLVTMYSAELSGAVAEAEDAIANMEPNPAMSGMNMDMLKEQLPVLLNKGVQALNDNIGMVVTLNAGTKGIQLNKLAVQKPSTESAQFLAGIKSSNVDELLKALPVNQPMYVASSVDFTKFAVQFYELMGESQELDAETKTALENLKSTFSSTTSKGFSVAMGLGNLEEGVLRTYGIQMVSPADVMKKVVKDSQAIMALFSGSNFSQEITLEENKETVNGKPVDVMHIEQDLSGGDPQVRQMAEMMTKVMYGEDGITTRMMYMDEGILQSMGGGTAGMEETYRAYQAKENLKSGSPLARDRAALPGTTAFVELFDLVTLIARGAVIAAESGQVPIPITPEQIEGIDVQPSYVGIAVTIEDNAIEGRLNIPIEQFQNGAKLATAVMQMMQPDAN